MENYILIPILVILAIVLMLVFYNWCKVIFKRFEDKNKQVDNQKIQQVDHPNISISFMQQDEPEKVLKLSQDQIMKIRINQVSYQQGQRVNVYQLRYDDNFNESYLHYEKSKDRKVKIYEQKSNSCMYEGNYDASLLKFQTKDIRYFQGVRKFNQNFLRLDFDSENTIDAFALYLNMEEEKIFLTNQNKRNWFVTSHITIQNQQLLSDLVLQLQNEFWQFQPIDYEVQMFCSKIFLVVNDLDLQSMYLVEVNFQDYLTIHTKAPQSTSYYQPLVESLQNFFLNIKHAEICLSCKGQDVQQSQGLNLCFNMMKYSSLPDRVNTPESMKQYLQNQLFLDLV